jgi:hypothetical protein
VQALRKLAEVGDGRIEVVLHGIPRNIESFHDIVRRTSHLYYEGPYNNPGELPKIYQKIDISWDVLYVGQYELMRTNRFYEGCFYNVPLIGQTGTLDGNLIEEYKIGITVDILDTESTVDRLLEISHDDVSRWRESMQDVPEDRYVYTDEHERLVDFLQ